MPVLEVGKSAHAQFNADLRLDGTTVLDDDDPVELENASEQEPEIAEEPPVPQESPSEQEPEVAEGLLAERQWTTDELDHLGE